MLRTFSQSLFLQTQQASLMASHASRRTPSDLAQGPCNPGPQVRKAPAQLKHSKRTQQIKRNPQNKEHLQTKIPKIPKPNPNPGSNGVTNLVQPIGEGFGVHVGEA